MAVPDPESTGDDDVLDRGDVSPVVLCAQCGSADCQGCGAETEAGGAPASAPWERPELRYWQRLWWTARDTTLSSEAFFSGLSRGSIAPALAFAITSELLAIGSFGIAFAAGVAVTFPLLLADLFGDTHFRGAVALGMAGAIAGLSVLMVLLHVLWGLSLEVGMRLQGAAPRGVHCLRYALYSCGWDLLTSPFGLAMACSSSGLGNGVAAVRAAVSVPRIATHAYLSAAKELDPRGARRALWTATLLTGCVVVTGTVGVATLAVVALI